MTGPQHRAWPRRLALLAGAAVLAASLVVPIDAGRTHALWLALADGAHLILFAALAAIAFALLARVRSAWRFAIAATLAIGFAAALEAIQPKIGRMASAADLLNGVLGVACGLGGIAVWAANRRRGPLRVLHAAATLACLGIAFHPAWLEVRARSWRKTNFPVLGAFESPIELRVWRPIRIGDRTHSALELSIDPDGNAGGMLRVETRSGAWAGVECDLDFADWSEYDALRLRVYNPGTPFTLGVRIDGGPQTRPDFRFDTRVAIEEGMNEVRVPLDGAREAAEERGLREVRRVLFFVRPREADRVSYLDEVGVVRSMRERD